MESFASNRQISKARHAASTTKVISKFKPQRTKPLSIENQKRTE